jgi:hypothetical protein
LSFSVKEGQNLTLPLVELDENCKATFADPGKVFAIGEKLQIK